MKVSEKPKKPKNSKKSNVLLVIWLLLWTGASLVASQFIIVYLLYFILGRETLTTPVWTTVMDALIYALTLFFVLFVPPRLFRKKTSPKKNPNWTTDREELGLKGLPTWTDIGLAPVGFIVYLLIAAALVWVFSIFPWFNPEETQEIGFNLYATGVDRIIAFITLVVLAPIAEELIFRGWLYGKLREKLSEKVSNNASMLISIFLVSLLFGIIHLQWNVGVNVFALSIVLCGLREITGTIYAGILLHMIKNGVALYLLYQIGL